MILTPDNDWIIGFTREPSTEEYYLVFYHEIRPILDRFIQLSEYVQYMQYGDFDELKEIGSGGYGTVYTAKYKKYSEIEYMVWQKLLYSNGLMKRRNYLFPMRCKQ